MCIPQRKIVGTDPLTLWFLLNVCRSAVLEYMAKSSSQRHKTLSLQLLVVGLSTLGLKRSKGQKLTKVMNAEVICITYTHTWLNQGTASIPQAAAAPPSLGWGQMLSSWFFPSAPSVDKHPQATSQPASSSSKCNGNLSSRSAYLMLFVSQRLWRWSEASVSKVEER